MCKKKVRQKAVISLSSNGRIFLFRIIQLIKIYDIYDNQTNLHRCSGVRMNRQRIPAENHAADCVDYAKLHYRSHQHRDNYKQRTCVSDKFKNNTNIHVYDIIVEIIYSKVKSMNNELNALIRE